MHIDFVVDEGVEAVVLDEEEELDDEEKKCIGTPSALIYLERGNRKVREAMEK